MEAKKRKAKVWNYKINYTMSEKSWNLCQRNHIWGTNTGENLEMKMFFLEFFKFEKV